MKKDKQDLEKRRTKIERFEQIVLELADWWQEQNPNKSFENNDLGILKIMKLLFFTCGANQESNLFDVFDRFQAWQYGHVEADVYDEYSKNKGDFKRFTIDRMGLKRKDYIEYPNVIFRAVSKKGDIVYGQCVHLAKGGFAILEMGKEFKPENYTNIVWHTLANKTPFKDKNGRDIFFKDRLFLNGKDLGVVSANKNEIQLNKDGEWSHSLTSMFVANKEAVYP